MINIMNYTFSTDPLGRLCSQAASPHSIITEVTTVVMNTVQRQIKTHNTLLHPQRNSIHGDDRSIMTKLFETERIEV